MPNYMVSYTAPLYEFIPEVWDDAKCKRVSRQSSPDAPGHGYLGSSASMPPAFGPVRYNGGVVREGKWWQGETRPFPIIPDTYEIYVVPSWGWYIRKRVTQQPTGVTE